MRGHPVDEAGCLAEMHGRASLHKNYGNMWDYGEAGKSPFYCEAVSKVIDPVILNFLPARLSGGVSGSQLNIHQTPKWIRGDLVQRVYWLMRHPLDFFHRRDTLQIGRRSAAMKVAQRRALCRMKRCHRNILFFSENLTFCSKTLVT